jgi:hypothetical protein
MGARSRTNCNDQERILFVRVKKRWMAWTAGIAASRCCATAGFVVARRSSISISSAPSCCCGRWKGETSQQEHNPVPPTILSISQRNTKTVSTIQRAGISTLPAEALLARMQATVDNLCAERDKLGGEQRVKYPGTDKVIKGPQMRLR